MPDILILDEPTNHLDLHAVAWLTAYLAEWPSTIIVVSHARDFLNDVCTDIILFKDQKLKTYKGDYDTYEKVREDELKVLINRILATLGLPNVMKMFFFEECVHTKVIPKAAKLN